MPQDWIPLIFRLVPEVRVEQEWFILHLQVDPLNIVAQLVLVAQVDLVVQVVLVVLVVLVVMVGQADSVPGVAALMQVVSLNKNIITK